jgi:oxygen-dependent protoporphyrinogen oxidase
MTTRVAVVGGGISGLTTAYYLKRASIEGGIELDIDLFEKSARLGGVIRSEKVDGMLLEAGPEGWVSYKPAPKKLVKDLHLQDEILGSNDHLRRTFVVREGRLTRLPEGMAFLAPVDPISFWKDAPMSVRGKLRASFEPFIPKSNGELSIGAFFERRLGTEFTETFVDPLVSAIYGADLRKLSMPVTMPELYGVEQRRGSLWRGLRKLAKMTLSNSVLLSMKEGMSSLISCLEDELQEINIHLSVKDLRVDALERRYEVAVGGQNEAYEHVAICTPAHAAGNILSQSLPNVSSLLLEVPYASTSLVRSSLGVSCAPIFGRVYHVRGVIPQLYVGHQKRVEAIGSALTKHQGLYLAGSYYGGVGLPECIRTGQEIAERIVNGIVTR